MFAGIIEALSPILSVTQATGVLRMTVQKPKHFDDLKTGDSIAVNGVCLTVESFSSEEIVFALAAETLKILGWQNIDSQKLIGQKLNLERSLRFGDRIHGHLVTGHVDSMGTITHRHQEGESLFLEVQVQNSIRPYVWKKGSITLNGTSLTVNAISENILSVCLIPETQKRTNLGEVQEGHLVTVEPDYMARAVLSRETTI